MGSEVRKACLDRHNNTIQIRRGDVEEPQRRGDGRQPQGGRDEAEHGRGRQPDTVPTLHNATACGRTEVARLLIKRGADVNAKDYKGCTPLRLARRYGQEEIEMMLEAKDAKDEQEGPSRKTSEGVDPPWMSASRRQSRREEVGVGAK